jgi:hypothetical protein
MNYTTTNYTTNNHTTTNYEEIRFADIKPVTHVQETFPMKLHRLLADLEQKEGGTKMAAFLPDGQSFMIKNPFKFEKNVMPMYFPRMKHFASFQRQLNLYDFTRVGGRGPAKGAYRHEMFVRGLPVLSRSMRRTKIKGSASEKI